MHANVRDVFFAPPGIVFITATFLTFILFSQRFYFTKTFIEKFIKNVENHF